MNLKISPMVKSLAGFTMAAAGAIGALTAYSNAAKPKDNMNSLGFLDKEIGNYGRAMVNMTKPVEVSRIKIAEEQDIKKSHRLLSHSSNVNGVINTSFVPYIQQKDNGVKQFMFSESVGDYSVIGDISSTNKDNTTYSGKISLMHEDASKAKTYNINMAENKEEGGWYISAKNNNTQIDLKAKIEKNDKNKAVINLYDKENNVVYSQETQKESKERPLNDTAVTIITLLSVALGLGGIAISKSGLDSY